MEKIHFVMLSTTSFNGIVFLKTIFAKIVQGKLPIKQRKNMHLTTEKSTKMSIERIAIPVIQKLSKAKERHTYEGRDRECGYRENAEHL